MLPFTALRLMASPEGQRLVETIRRSVSATGMQPEQVVKEWLDHMDRLEAVAKKAGKTVKQVEDEALALYEKQLK